MASFDELLKNKEVELPDEYREQLETAYLESLETRDEKITSLEPHNAELDAKVKSYAVANFDLVRKVDTSKDPKPEPKDEEPKRMSTSELVAKMRGK